ncbi:MAG TPA: hypothetical protein PK490_18600, partial [Prosthecobacter sp.]|nr:hypothetical protein [Prosthecobacter sp.]
PRAQILRPVFHAPLDARAPEPEALENIPLAEMTRPVFQVLVDPRGNVTAALPLAAADSAEVTARLREAVARMRFRPDSSGKAGQGRVSFRWEDAAP